MNRYRFVRVLRTASSERFVIESNQTDAGAVDIHYLDGGRVFATLVLLDSNELREDFLENVIKDIDEVLLPNASREEGSVVFTVVRGTVVGSFVDG